MGKVNFNGIEREATAEEQAEYDARQTEWANGAVARKLEQIKDLRLRRLQATDYLANSDVTMPDYIKTWRQTLRDLPQNNTTESQYDTLLETTGSFPNKSYVHSVWTQPTE